MLYFYRWQAGSKVKLNGFLAQESDTDSSTGMIQLLLWVCLFVFFLQQEGECGGFQEAIILSL